jgi:hypothetical protein
MRHPDEGVAPGAERALTDEERALVAVARETAFVLYEGKRVLHRSCGIALAATWGLPTRPYQSLRRGGITGEGECGAIKAGELILGELLGDPDPTGGVTDALRAALIWYQREVRLRLFPPDGRVDITCNSLTRPLGDFAGEVRKSHCTNLAAVVAETVAEALVRFGGPCRIAPLPER